MTKNNPETDPLALHVQRLLKLCDESTEDMGPLETKFVEDLRRHLERYRSDCKEADHG